MCEKKHNLTQYMSHILLNNFYLTLNLHYNVYEQCIINKV
jgi:hypothetical protein